MIPQPVPGQHPNEGPAPSPEELLAMVEYLQKQGLDMDQVPSDLKVKHWLFPFLGSGAATLGPAIIQPKTRD